MDVGTGSFVLANALVSREARGVPPTRECHFGVEPYCLGYNAVVVLHNVLPLLVCGIVRAVAVYAFDYQQPVSEYGVYWNFFFTLAAVCSIGQLVTSRRGTPRSPAPSSSPRTSTHSHTKASGT